MCRATPEKWARGVSLNAEGRGLTGVGQWNARSEFFGIREDDAEGGCRQHTGGEAGESKLTFFCDLPFSNGCQI